MIIGWMRPSVEISQGQFYLANYLAHQPSPCRPVGHNTFAIGRHFRILIKTMMIIPFQGAHFQILAVGPDTTVGSFGINRRKS